MSDFLKTNRNGQILEIVLDRPKANTLDAPACREMGRLLRGWNGAGNAAGEESSSPDSR